MLRETENSEHREIFRHKVEGVSGGWVKNTLREASCFVFFTKLYCDKEMG
jgi:hypothetical protein